LMKAFKMACLNYKPNKILYKGRVHTREDLFDLREEMIKEQLELMNELLPAERFTFDLTQNSKVDKATMGPGASDEGANTLDTQQAVEHL